MNLVKIMIENKCDVPNIEQWKIKNLIRTNINQYGV